MRVNAYSYISTNKGVDYYAFKREYLSYWRFRNNNFKTKYNKLALKKERMIYMSKKRRTTQSKSIADNKGGRKKKHRNTPKNVENKVLEAPEIYYNHTKTWFYVVIFSILLLVQMFLVVNNRTIGNIAHYNHIILMVIQYIFLDWLMKYHLKKANIAPFTINRQSKILSISCVNVALVTLIILLLLAPSVGALELIDLVGKYFKVTDGQIILISIILILAVIFKNYQSILDTKKDLIANDIK